MKTYVKNTSTSGKLGHDIHLHNTDDGGQVMCEELIDIHDYIISY